ncbi:MAG TPA: ATP-dependent DNA helicase RecG, partial [Thermoleophilaceae bacterium]
MATLFASREELTRDDALAAPVRSYPRPIRLAEPVSLRGAAGKALATLGIETVGDLLEHLPHSHRDRRDVRPVADLGVGEEATVAVGVRGVTVRPMRDRRRKRVEARVFDETGPLVAVWFNQPWIARQLEEGAQVLLHGKLRRRNEFWVTEHEVFGDGGAPVHTVGLVPVHPATEGITPGRLRQLAWDSYPRFFDVVEPLPAQLRVEERLPDRPASLATVHFPDREQDERDARRRLAFEELLMLQLAVAGRRRTRREGRRARPLAPRGVLVDRWRWSLPFELTGDQVRAMEEIDRDIAGERPMQRLLMGEVGSGKTVCALHAMLRAVENGAQAALMAPTETLAEQHHRTLDSLLGGQLPLELLTGSTPAGRRRDLLARLDSGQLHLVVGTHALIEDTVKFRDLALAVVDEQHRFGVRQRAALDRKAPAGLAPHALHMTATPIPRTLSLTAYGDLDATVLRELPAGRQPVETYVVGGARARARAYERIREEIAAGRQCFVVCPLVEESEALQARAATAEYERLRSTEFRDQRVELIHGQMPSKRKQAAMEAFAAGDADVLVATSVIEVGIDVPNATVMVIEAAERYGLSQLHQLRGRVGRGEHPSLCILFGD